MLPRHLLYLLFEGLYERPLVAQQGEVGQELRGAPCGRVLFPLRLCSKPPVEGTTWVRALLGGQERVDLSGTNIALCSLQVEMLVQAPPDLLGSVHEILDAAAHTVQNLLPLRTRHHNSQVWVTNEHSVHPMCISSNDAHDRL